MLELCLKPITTRSKYANLTIRRCQRVAGHEGKCHEYPCLVHLNQVAPKVADKIKRDATNTTGAAWSSADAGPNRILRWVMLLPDEELEQYGVPMNSLKPIVVAKLREKAATYEDCMAVARMLTWLAYQMADAPPPPQHIKAYLESFFGAMNSGSTTCAICKLSLSFTDFSAAKRGRALIETGHLNPRLHNTDNICFAHRECNIAQGSKSLQEFYDWIYGILQRAGRL